MRKAKRCRWAETDPFLKEYHDEEWGIPVHDDLKLFEFLILEGAQAGLNWLIILKKRNAFRIAFEGFDPEKIASFSSTDVKRLLANKEIIRNRLKISAAVTNARQFISIQDEFDSFNDYIWQFVGGKPIKHRFRSASSIPDKSRESDRMSEDLKTRGFKFVGSTICYAFMQATGMVNDHVTNCFRYSEVSSR
ncbi:MAG TPA: DNA-3-methyladenine glycosylase I [Candidatus Dormibacteraeota bacterium]|nr:DNA-3-methyladenine glycosylase I [Candidatus Dormibacteraeota bacterium]